MASLTLANMLTRVKRIVPSTLMNTELEDALLERMNYLATLDAFPFQERYQEETLISGEYRLATPDNFAYIKSISVWMSDNKEREIDLMDAVTFLELFPKPNEREIGVPIYCCVRINEGEIWFDCPADGNLIIRMESFHIPDDATDVTVTQLTELAKLALVKWASADGFRMMSEFDRADKLEVEGNRYLDAMQKRYGLALERNARIMSLSKKKMTS